MPVSAVVDKDFEPMPMRRMEAVFAKKVPVSSQVFDGLRHEARAKAFRIAAINKASLIQRVMDEVQSGIRTGRSFRDIQVRLRGIFADEGQADFPISRLWITLRQNMLTTAAIHKQRILDDPAVRLSFPFRQYVTVGNGTPNFAGVRPEHARPHNLVFAADDKFWDSHTPPWEWGCRCTFRPLTASQVDRMGVKVRNLEHVKKELDIDPNPEFDFPRDQLRDAASLLQFEAGLRAKVKRAFKRADQKA